MAFDPGGNGGIANGNDVALNNPLTGEGLLFDETIAKWKNQEVYIKPVSGIPDSDLSSDTQAKLNATTTVLVLEANESVPANTPEGVLIFRKVS